MVSVEIENAINPSMKILMIGVCVICFIVGVVLRYKFSALPIFSPYKYALSLVFAIVLAIVAFITFRYLSSKRKNSLARRKHH
jgi:membrane protein implicated in regulation of membrane protease activity